MNPELASILSMINRADQAYYRDGLTPIMGDAEYDALKARARALDPENEVLHRVGVPYQHDEVGTKHKHTIPMGSLDNTDDGIAGYDKWYSKISKELGEAPKVHASLKVDGNSIALIYENDRLVRALTRGNGSVGDDITANAVMFRGVPNHISGFTGTIRGEAVLHRSEFAKLTEGKAADEISNPRNIGSGIIGREDGTQSDLLSFYAFNLFQDGVQYDSEECSYEALTRLGFSTPPWVVLTDSASVKQHHDSVLDNRDNLPFDIDGLVIHLNDRKHQAKFVTDDPKTRLRPKYARAIKFPSFTAITKVTGVTVTIGHQGTIVPTLDVERVRCGGIFIDSVIITNYDTPKNNDIAIGDTVQICLAGDIVPNFSRVVHRPDDRVAIEEPTQCPVCGSATTRTLRGKDSANLYCTNKACEGAAKAKINHWIGSSRSGVGILDIGDKIVDALWRDGIVKSTADLYKIKPEDIENVVTESGSRIGSSKARTICGNINDKRELPLTTFLGALGIDLLGTRRAANMIAYANGALNTIEDWLDLDKLRTIELPGVGDAIRSELVAGMEALAPLVRELLAAGVVPLPEVTDDAPDESTLPYSGLSFCFTGTREGVKEVIALGGKIDDDVRKGTQYLVQKSSESTSNKTIKATKLGAKVISVDQLKQAIAEGNAP